MRQAAGKRAPRPSPRRSPTSIGATVPVPPRCRRVCRHSADTADRRRPGRGGRGLRRRGIGAGGFLAGALRLGAAFFGPSSSSAFFAACALSVFSSSCAGAAFFFFAGFLLRFFFAFFAMIVLPIHVEVTSAPSRRPLRFTTTITTRLAQPAAVAGRIAARGRCSRSCLRTWSAGRPIDQLDRMNDRKFRARRDLRDAADIACCNHVRSQSSR